MIIKNGNIINNRYKVLSLLGQGGMGYVYEVYDFVENRIVALKMVKDKIFSNKAIERFKNEFKLAINLNHPNIIKVFDLGTYDENETYFFTMECIEGMPLTDAYNKMSEYEKFDVMLKLARGLNYIHNRHIVHFDIKPDNIYLIKTEDGYDVKIMDFGLASILEEFTGKVRGTLSYIAPEVMLKKEVDYKADLYSTGMVLYHIFSDKLPFDTCSSLKEIARAKSSEAFLDEEAFHGLENDFLKNLITDLCRARKEDRIQSAFQLVGYLEAVLELDLRENEYNISDNLNDKYFDRDKLLEKLQRDYLNFCLRGEKNAGKLTVITGEEGCGKSALLQKYSIKAQLNRLPVTYIKVKKQNKVNSFFRKLIFSLIGFAENNANTRESFRKAQELIDNKGAFKNIKSLVLKIKEILSDIFENMSVKKSIILIVDNLENLNEDDNNLFQFVLHQLVTVPVFLILTVNSDQIENSRIENHQEIFYLFPPERIRVNNLRIDELKEYLSILLNVPESQIDPKLFPVVMQQSSGNIFIIRKYIEFLLENSFLFNKDGKYIFNIFADLEFNYDMSNIFQNRLVKLTGKEKFLLLTILEKLTLDEKIAIFAKLFKIKNIESMLDNLQKSNFLDFTTNNGVRQYYIKNKNVEKVLRDFFQKQNLTPYYTIMADFFSKRCKKSIVKFSYCLVRSKASLDEKKNVLLKTIEYTRASFKEQDLCNFLAYYYENFPIPENEREKRLQELYYLFTWIGESSKAYKYYKELLTTVIRDKNKYETAKVLSDAAFFGNQNISLNERLDYLEKSSIIFFKEKKYNEYYQVAYKMITIYFRSGLIEKCIELINKVKKISQEIDVPKKVAEKLKIFSTFMLSAKDFYRSSLYSRLIKLYHYLDADYISPDEDLDLVHLVIIEQLLNGNRDKASNTIEIYIKKLEGKKNQITEVSLFLIYAHVLEEQSILDESYSVYLKMEKILEKRKSVNGVLLILVDKIRLMINQRMDIELVSTELKKAMTIARNLNNYEMIIALYSLQIEFFLFRGEWREVDLDIKYCLNILSETDDVFIIKNFIFTACFYYYIIKDGESFYSLIDKLSIVLSSKIEENPEIKVLYKELNLLFNLPNKENLENLGKALLTAYDRPFIFLAIFKILNNGWEGNLKSDPVWLLRLIRKGKEQTIANPVFFSYLRAMELLLQRNFAESMEITTRLGKDNFSKGYIFDCYLPILSSNFYFKAVDSPKKAKYFESKLIKLNNRLSARLPYDKRNNFTQKFWVY